MTRGMSGFAMIAAIALLLFFASLSAALLYMSTVQHTVDAQDTSDETAYRAARTGIEWGAYQVLRSGTACSGGVCTLPSLPSLPAPLDGFVVMLACQCTVAFDEAGSSVEVFQVSATASSGTIGTPQRVERKMEAKVTR